MEKRYLPFTNSKDMYRLYALFEKKFLRRIPFYDISCKIIISRKRGDRMTAQEAIERIKYRIETASLIAGKGVDGKAFEDLDMAIEALEKQIPKKVVNFEKACDIYGKCPKCKEMFWITEGDEFNYCPTCGQALDWSEEE